MVSRLTELVLDCADPERLATFWCGVLGWDELDREDDATVSLALALHGAVFDGELVIERAWRDLKTQWQADVRLVLGGGAANEIAGALGVPHTRHDSLVLSGLALIARWSEDASLDAALARLPAVLDGAPAAGAADIETSLAGMASLYVIGRGPTFPVRATCTSWSWTHTRAPVAARACSANPVWSVCA